MNQGVTWGLTPPPWKACLSPGQRKDGYLVLTGLCCARFLGGVKQLGAKVGIQIQLFWASFSVLVCSVLL